MFKRSLSVFLVIIVIMMLFSVVPMSVEAHKIDSVEDGANIGLSEIGFSIRTTYPGTSNYYYIPRSAANPFAVNTHGGNCTWYAWGRVFEASGEYPNLPRGDANTWYNSASCAKGRTPRPGAVICGNYGVNGHVAFVEKVYDDGVHFDFTESNWDSIYPNFAYNPYKTTANFAGFQGFLYPFDGGNPVPAGSRTVYDGEYYITSALDDNKVLDIDYDKITSNKANAQLWSLLKMPNQVFSIKHIGDGYYNIICKSSGKYLEVEGGIKDAGTNVQQYEGNGTDAQQWVIKETGDGYYYIVSKCNGLYLDVDNGSSVNGTNIKVYTENSSNAQKWRFLLLGAHSFSDGDYYITSALDNNKVLDIDYDIISSDKANAQLWSLLNMPNQVFSVKHIGDGYYNIICKKAVNAWKLKAGMLIQAQTCSNIQVMAQMHNNG